CGVPGPALAGFFLMRPFTSTISLDEARRRLDATVRPIARLEEIGLADAAGRVIAADVPSPIDVPAFARSAMDGYAVVSVDTTHATSKPRVAILSTGNEVVDPGRPLNAGQIYDVNRFTLAAIVDAHGGVPQSRKAAQDTLQSLTDALAA